jgi:Protein of unknown function (DUF3365)
MPHFFNIRNIILASSALAVVSGCSSGTNTSGGISPQVAADAIHTVLEADRTAYTKLVVNRLQNEEKIIKATEHWKDEKTLPLPAQMFRAGAEIVEQKGAAFSYSLLSSWPINKKNMPKTDAEKEGLDFVAKNPDKSFSKEENLGGKKYFTAVYADKAIAEACVVCHNNHADTPRKDFKLNDVMGGVIIRIPLGS